MALDPRAVIVLGKDANDVGSNLGIKVDMGVDPAPGDPDNDGYLKLTGVRIRGNGATIAIRPASKGLTIVGRPATPIVVDGVRDIALTNNPLTTDGPTQSELDTEGLDDVDPALFSNNLPMSRIKIGQGVDIGAWRIGDILKIYSTALTAGRSPAGGGRAARYGEFCKIVFIDTRANKKSLWVARLDFADRYKKEGIAGNDTYIVRLDNSPVVIEGVRFTSADDAGFETTPTTVAGTALVLSGLLEPRIDAAFDRTWATGLEIESCYGADIRARVRGILNWPNPGHGPGYGVTLGQGSSACKVRVDGRDCRHALTTDFKIVRDGGADDNDIFNANNWRDYGWTIDNVISGHVVNGWGPCFDTHEFSLRTVFMDCQVSNPRPGVLEGASGTTAFSDRGCDTRYIGCTSHGASVGYYLSGQDADHERPNITTLVGVRSTGNRLFAIRTIGMPVGSRREAAVTNSGTTASQFAFNEKQWSDDFTRGMGVEGAKTPRGLAINTPSTTNDLFTTARRIAENPNFATVVHQPLLTIVNGTNGGAANNIVIADSDQRALVARHMSVETIDGTRKYIGTVSEVSGGSTNVTLLADRANQIATLGERLVLGARANWVSTDTAAGTTTLELLSGKLGLQPGILVRAPRGSPVRDLSRIVAVSATQNQITIIPALGTGQTATSFYTIAFMYPDAIEIDGGYFEAGEDVIWAEEGTATLTVRDAHLVCDSDGVRVARAVRSAAGRLVLDQPTISVRSDVVGIASPTVLLDGRTPSAVVLAPRFHNCDGRSTPILATQLAVSGSLPATVAARVRTTAAVGLDVDDALVPGVPTVL